MTKLKKIIVFILVILVFSFLFLVRVNINIERGRTYFMLGESFKDFKQMINMNYIFEFTNNESYLKIIIYQNLTKVMSDSLINEKIQLINQLYRQINSPYPGKISNIIGCSPEFLPQKLIENKQIYQVYANDRFIYGSCTEDSLKFKSIVYYKYCEDMGILLEIKLFFSKNESVNENLDKVISIKCWK